MVKGIQRQMIMVRTPESEMFEMAYLVLRDIGRAEECEQSMIDEANSIVSSLFGDGAYKKRERRRQKRKRTVQFLLGAFFGALLFLFLMLILGVL